MPFSSTDRGTATTQREAEILLFGIRHPWLSRLRFPVRSGRWEANLTLHGSNDLAGIVCIGHWNPRRIAVRYGRDGGWLFSLLYADASGADRPWRGNTTFVANPRSYRTALRKRRDYNRGPN